MIVTIGARIQIEKHPVFPLSKDQITQKFLFNCDVKISGNKFSSFTGIVWLMVAIMPNDISFFNISGTLIL
ncbi:MAG: hypothetical protein Ct9H300mP28_20820 [Pseudomonadota bacterium]|nr:MAG: hypothetical protein Ct9H300mP28_20820 [Pseudomonadota bacterium]